MTEVCRAARTLQAECHQAAKDAGWWTDPKTGLTIDPAKVPYLVAAKLMLCVSELAEAMEGDRKGLMDDHLPHRRSIEVELADLVIRAADLCGALGLDLGAAISEKMDYNRKRDDHKLAHRLGQGGKKY